MRGLRGSLLLAVAVVALDGPYEFPLRASRRVPDATGHARLVSAPSPFGVAVTADGRSRYLAQVTAAGLPEPSTLGPYSVYLAWEASTDLKTWTRLGTVTNGVTTVGTLQLNKFLLVITAESSDTVSTRQGPTVLNGNSPSSWLQSFITHPLFRGISQ